MIITIVVLACEVRAARASAIQLASPSDLGFGGRVVTYPTGAPADPFDITAGTVTLTFSTPEFFFFDVSDGTNYDFPAGTRVLGTTPNGPLTIRFSTGIREVGLVAQGLALDIELKRI